MKSTWDGNTRGLGAGSYPEPPDLPDYGHEPGCEVCEDDQDLKAVDGMLLCEFCRKNHYLENYRNMYWPFIRDHDGGNTKRDFALHWWFENLPEKTQGEIAFRAFEREYDSCLPQLLNLREGEISGYVKDHADDFLEYMEERCKHETV